MGKQDEETGISWTDYTHNTWLGCWKISPGCQNCYAAAMDQWLHKSKHWDRRGPRKFLDDAYWKRPLLWNKAARRVGERRRVFVGSMCDWAEQHPDPKINARMDVARDRLWALIAQTEHLDWLLLTKRIENVAALLPKRAYVRPGNNWSTPWPNVWIGATCEDDEHAKLRIPILMAIPATVHFVSYEPALGPIDWASIKKMPAWIIFGDESGRKKRPAELEWARQTRDACLARGSAFHFKQWCGADADGLTGVRDRKKKIHLPVLDGASYKEFPGV